VDAVLVLAVTLGTERNDLNTFSYWKSPERIKIYNFFSSLVYSLLTSKKGGSSPRHGERGGTEIRAHFRQALDAIAGLYRYPLYDVEKYTPPPGPGEAYTLMTLRE
jgi:hypothetical protein